MVALAIVQARPLTPVTRVRISLGSPPSESPASAGPVLSQSEHPTHGGSTHLVQPRINPERFQGSPQMTGVLSLALTLLLAVTLKTTEQLDPRE